MSKLEPDPKAPIPQTNRQICQRYADDAASFIGQQEGLGITAAVAAVATAGLGVGVSNADQGDTWQKNRKTIFLTTSAVSAVVSYVFLDNAKSASTSASQASIALASKDDDEMWAGCQHARASYFDGRAASIDSTKAVMANAGVQKQTDDAKKAAEDAKESAKKAADSETKATDAADQATKAAGKK